jgi:dihydrolipoamide dehydrogenase
MPIIEVKVPDIGDFKDVAVVEVLVKPGDAVVPEQSLITVESDKATMEIPAPAAGVVQALAVKVGDKVNEGSAILTLEAADAPAAAPAQPAAAAPAAPAAPAPASAAFAGKADIECEMVVLGSGPGGYSAAFRAADLGMKTVLVERYATLGGVCLNVGCIPSKALLHVAAVMEEAKHFADLGIEYAPPKVDLDRLRAHKDKVVGKLTGGIAAMAKGRKVEVVTGVGTFVGPHHMAVETAAGRKVIRFGSAIIAAG